jgi:hypothetical protein
MLLGAGLPLHSMAADVGDLVAIVVQVAFGDQALVRLISLRGPLRQQVAHGLQPALNGRQEVVQWETIGFFQPPQAAGALSAVL